MTNLQMDLDNLSKNILVNRLIKEGKAELLGTTKEKPDIDLLTGNLREEGKRVLNINEEIRKNNKEKK